MRDAQRVARYVADLRGLLEEMAALVARGRSAFDEDIAIRLAVERTAEKVGEAVKRLTRLAPDRFDEQSWRSAARFRDMLAHHYEGIDDEQVWRIAERRMPQLSRLLEDMQI